MDFIITGKPSEEALSQLIESLIQHIIQNELYKRNLTVPEAAETVNG